MSNQQSPRGSMPLPRRPLTPVVIPIVVLVCTFALLAWSAWPVLRPSRAIDVTQALVVPTSAPDKVRASGEPEPAQSTRTVQAAGWLEAEPYIVAASALADGVIERMLVLEGDRVEQGQILARMVDDDAKLRVARTHAELESARAALEMAQATLTAAENNWEEPYELERAIASGQAQLDAHQAELAQLPSLIRTEKALLVKAQEELRSIEQAYESNAAAEIEYIAARELVNAQAARYDAMKEREPILKATVARLGADLRAAQRALELRIQDREQLDMARAQLRSARAEVDRRVALHAQAELELERMTIRSPISGYVQRRLKAPGDKVVRMMDDPYSAHIAHLYDPSRIQVRVDVPLADASQVYRGQPCEIVVEVLPDQTFAGEVLIVTHEADLQKNTLEVKVKVFDPDPVLRPEMLTRVKFLPDGGTDQNDEMENAHQVSRVRVPIGVIEDGANPRIWLVTDRANGRGVLQPVPVTRIDEDNGWATVEADLQPGSMIAADPSNCTTGERVRINAMQGGAG